MRESGVSEVMPGAGSAGTGETWVGPVASTVAATALSGVLRSALTAPVVMAPAEAPAAKLSPRESGVTDCGPAAVPIAPGPPDGAATMALTSA